MRDLEPVVGPTGPDKQRATSELLARLDRTDAG